MCNLTFCSVRQQNKSLKFPKLCLRRSSTPFLCLVDKNSVCCRESYFWLELIIWQRDHTKKQDSYSAFSCFGFLSSKYIFCVNVRPDMFFLLTRKPTLLDNWFSSAKASFVHLFIFVVFLCRMHGYICPCLLVK